jgi:hypothetical protein
MDHTVAMEDVNGRTGEPGIFQPATSITYFSDRNQAKDAIARTLEYGHKEITVTSAHR